MARLTIPFACIRIVSQSRSAKVVGYVCVDCLSKGRLKAPVVDKEPFYKKFFKKETYAKSL